MLKNKMVVLTLFLGVNLVAGYISANASDLHSSLPLGKWPTNAKVDREIDQLVEEMDKMSRETVELEGLPVAFDNLCNGILKIGIAGLPETIKQIENRDKDWKTRLTLISLIPYLRDIDSVKRAIIQPLANILLDKSDDKMVRTAVCTYGFSKLKDTTATEALIETMEDKSNPNELRANASRAFVSLRDRKAIPHLLDLAKNDHDRDVRAMAVWALGSNAYHFRDTTITMPLVKMLNDEGNDIVRMKIIGALSVTGDKRAVKPLIELVKARESNFDDAIKALGFIGNNEAKILLLDLALNDAKEWVRLDAVEALIEIGDKELSSQIQEAIEGLKDSGRKRVLTDRFFKKLGSSRI